MRMREGRPGLSSRLVENRFPIMEDDIPIYIYIYIYIFIERERERQREREREREGSTIPKN